MVLMRVIPIRIRLLRQNIILGNIEPILGRHILTTIMINDILLIITNMDSAIGRLRIIEISIIRREIITKTMIKTIVMKNIREVIEITTGTRRIIIMSMFLTFENIRRKNVIMTLPRVNCFTLNALNPSASHLKFSLAMVALHLLHDQRLSLPSVPKCL